MNTIAQMLANAAFITIMGPTAHRPSKDCPDNIEKLEAACRKLKIQEVNANTIPRKYLKLPKRECDVKVI